MGEVRGEGERREPGEEDEVVGAGAHGAPLRGGGVCGRGGRG